jgi:hypothetical protein
MGSSSLRARLWDSAPTKWRLLEQWAAIAVGRMAGCGSFNKEEKGIHMSAMRCYVCNSAGDNIASDCREVYLEDDGHKTVYVGPTCFKKIEQAGGAGLQSWGGGPRVFFTFDQAAAFQSTSASKQEPT